MKGSDEKRTRSKTEKQLEENQSEKSKKAATKGKAKAPAKPRIKPSFYYVSSSEDEAEMLKDRFWKDLEDGKVDIFRTADLYSTVKAIGRSARPKSLAESDLQKSGIKSMDNEASQSDTKQRGRRLRKVAEKEPKKGKKETAADKSKAKRSSKSLSGTRLRVNLGTKVDHDVNSARKSYKDLFDDDDNEQDLADSDIDEEIVSKKKLPNKKKVKQTREQEDDEESDEDEIEEDEDDEEKEEDTDESESEEEVKEKQNLKRKVVVNRTTEKGGNKGKNKGRILMTRGNAKKQNKKKGRESRSLDEDDDDDEDEMEESESEETPATKRKTKAENRKVPTSDSDDDNEEDDESDDEIEEKNDTKAVIKKGATKQNKEERKDEANDEQEDEEADDGPKEDAKSEVASDPDAVTNHMVEAIDRVIAESALFWQENYGDDSSMEEQDEDLTDVVDDDEESRKRGKKRRLDDENENVPSKKVGSRLKKVASNPIDYNSQDSDAELQTKGAEWDKKSVSAVGDSFDADVDRQDSDQNCKSTVERDEETEEILESSSDISVKDGSNAEVEVGGSLKVDSSDGVDSAPVDEIVEEENLDHLIFNLKTVDAVVAEELVDAYSEWNIKALTNEDLFKAVKFNDFDLVRAMMREAQQFDLDQTDPSGTTLTMIATQNYFVEIVELLVLNGADVNAKTKDGHTALAMACDKGLHCAASVLLCLGANINTPLSTGETPLILAVKKNHYHVVRILLDHGVNIGATTSISDRHALSIARQLNHQPIVEILTSHKTLLTSELFQQISMALEGSAKISASVFPIQCFRLCDSNSIVVDFRHELQPTQTNRGMLLFFGHGCGSASNVNVKLYGSCAVAKAVLNGVVLQPLNEDNFILTFCPLRDGHNELEIFTIPLTRDNYKTHLIVGAFIVTLL